MILLKDIIFKSLINESKQSIINLGYPEIITKLFYKKFGNNSFLIARWFKEYHSNQYTKDDKNWWTAQFGGFGQIKLNDYVKLYYSTSNSEEYAKMLKHLDLSHEDVSHYDEYYLKEQRETIKKEIEKILFDDVFFAYYFSIINDIISGKLKDVKPYEKISFRDEALKYDEKKIFE